MEHRPYKILDLFLLFLIRYKILELCTLHCKNIADLGIAELSVVQYDILTLFLKWWSEYK